MFVKPSLDETALQQIFDLLHAEHGVDFSKYKMGTIVRRIEREMVRNKIYDLDSYVDWLTKAPIELDKLFQALLIPVTSFFRDKKTFQVFKREVVPELLNRALLSKSLRIWVPGCSTGEEVYSILICLLEHIEKLSDSEPSIKIEVFGTDINTQAVQYARKGIYSVQKVAGVSQARLEKYFVKEKGGYRICNSIRNVCIFARHNLLEDPPFFHLDLISCQNVLIYFNSVAQKHVFNLFQFGLNSGGCLMLGKTEGMASYLSSFSRWKPGLSFFVKKPKKLISPLDSQIGDGCTG